MTETVTVLKPAESGVDSYGDPIETWEPEEIPGCLVYELSGEDAVDRVRPDGVTVSARVQLPDAAMAGRPRGWLRGCRMALTGRGQEQEDAYDVVGSPERNPGMPTRWGTTIELGRAVG
jgi:hypothetical protein